MALPPSTSSSSSTAPPVLPLPRQPSPLSFSSAGHGYGHEDHYFLQPSNRSSPVPSVFESEDRSSEISDGNNAYLQPHSHSHSHSQGGRAASSSSSTSFVPATTTGAGQEIMPIKPLPDSLIYRTTLKQLESQTVTLKRLSKTVLSNLATVSGIYDQLDSAEDELMGSLGELSRWLGHGYGLQPGVWDEDRGVREVRREKRKRQKEDLEVMVHQSVENVRGELKRRGLAGGGATAKYEKAQQGYYSQTGAYLAPTSTNLPSSQSTHSLHINSNTPIPSSDKAQMARTAQIDALSYQHHSALLYATPPSSLVCLDLLVSLHSWAGTILPETSIPHPSHPVDPDSASTASTTPRVPSGLATPARITSRPQATSSGMNSLKNTLADSLASMASVRSDLLHCWSLRNTQQQILEDRASRKQAEVDGTWNVIDSPAVPPGWTGPVTSSTHHTTGGVGGSGSKPKKTHYHKVHRSVGGRLRDLLSTNSSYSLSNSERGGSSAGAGGGSRTSFDLNLNLNLNSRPGGSSRMRTESVPEHSVMESSSLMRRQSDSTSTTPPRPAIVSRHSVQLDREKDYRSLSPLTITANGNGAEETLSSSSPMEMMHGDRGEVGRKHEGVLWGPGTWEGLGRPNSKSKWEMTWVVLDHSKIYEYGGIDTNQYDCQAVIDLRFASVREGRDTDRRFVFEVISAKSGRRLYQATSEVELKMWLYAIANAIESCINGTSSVRTFDDSKLRTSSGALDDHALPARRGHKPLGLGFPLPPIPSTPGNRRSMPPLGHSQTDLHLRERLREGERDKERRTRKTSFKNVLKSSGEKWLNRHSTSTTFDIPRPPPPPQLAPVSGSVAATPRPEVITRASLSSNSGRTTPPPQSQSQSQSQISGQSTASPSRSVKESWDGYDSSHDTTIEARVYEMAGLGLGLGTGESPVSSPLQSRRVQSEGVNKHLQPDVGGGEMSRSKSADVDSKKEKGPEMTMKTLRELADKVGNNICADCKRPTKASQWATLNLRGVPMVMFLCIRCCGLHRGLGTHISKPRAINLDHWSPESIKLAWEWGNVRGNTIWERNRPLNVLPNDENISNYIRDKYVEGRWLSPEDRDKFTWAETTANINVGRAM